MQLAVRSGQWVLAVDPQMGDVVQDERLGDDRSPVGGQRIMWMNRQGVELGGNGQSEMVPFVSFGCREPLCWPSVCGKLFAWSWD